MSTVVTADATASPARQRVSLWVAGGQAAVLALALVLASLVARLPIWRDEAATLRAVGGNLAGLRHVLAHQDAIFTVYYGALHLLALRSSVPWWLRVPSVLAFAVTVLAVMVMARRRVGPWQSVVAGLFVALNPLLLDEAGQARSYALATAACVGSLSCAFRWVERGGRRWGVACVAFAVAATYLHLYAFPAVLLPLLVLAARRPTSLPRRAPLTAAAVVTMLALPDIVIGLDQRAQVAWVSRLKVVHLFRATTHYPGGSTALVVAVLLAVGAVLMARGRHGRPALAEPAATVRADETWMLAGVVAAYGLVLPMAALAVPIYVPRYTVFAVPALSLLLVVLLDDVRRGLGGRRRWIGAVVSAAAVVAVVASMLVGVTGDVSGAVRADDFPAAAAYVATNALPGDLVVTPWLTDATAYGRYLPYSRLFLRHLPSRRGVGRLYVSDVPDRMLRRDMQQVHRVWVLTYGTWLKSRGRRLVALLARGGFSLSTVERFGRNGDDRVSVFTRT